MIEITVGETEYYDSEANEFMDIPGGVIQMEHSLFSISKWEAKWKRPFLSETKGPQTQGEVMDYLRCMIVNDVDPRILNALTESDLKKILDYIDDSMTATWFSKKQRGRRGGVMTSEVIYWQMCMYGIPFECEHWHLNRLLTLIRVCNEKEQPTKKMSNRELLGMYSATNAKRRKPKV